MSLSSKCKEFPLIPLSKVRLVVSFEDPNGPLIEEVFPGEGELSHFDRAQYLFILARYWLNNRQIITFGELQKVEPYYVGKGAEEFFQYVRDRADLAFVE
jgi:hypothetical protein